MVDDVSTDDPGAPSEVVGIETELGPARAHLWKPAQAPVGRIVLGHGAGGGIGAADLVAVRKAAVAAGWLAVLVEQPWRVAGKKVAAAPPKLDIGWRAVLAALNRRPDFRRRPVPLVLGGRSAGARVACRTAAELGATAVCCLAFPLHPPGRPEKSRADEIALPAEAGIGVLVVQGAKDPFGSGPDIEALGLPGVEVVGVEGDHSLKKYAPVAEAVAARLPGWAKHV
ncbi:alpha/beta hydrolase family protein [Kineosporia succinea]|uniref:Alpha/beta-hydrolase family hydrolase n=1 Tax=Kineosporia succinea TaxID=84632 RepID=A0ABT9P416_9ACTN|nr:alpha/beta family hydrolase [Kineosporia succinea]MDP9827443.1 putative alpha/beta-hydrolase family hydrolase [Kineosporia succinea]